MATAAAIARTCDMSPAMRVLATNEYKRVRILLIRNEGESSTTNNYNKSPACPVLSLSLCPSAYDMCAGT